MTTYLLDTNVLLRVSDEKATDHLLAIDAISTLLAQNHQVCITAQNLVELWAVATRPIAVNGLGWTQDRTNQEIDQFLNQFQFVRDSELVFPQWRSLVAQYDIKGKKTHDARLVAVMLTYQIPGLVTFNGDDFRAFRGITVLHPTEIILP